MNIAKWLFFIGIGCLVVAGLIFLFTKLGIPIGKLPGDIRIKGEKYGIYFPIVTSLVISIILTVLLNLFFYLFRK
ncbi:MAG: DUF2905 domain-containing protein [Verrucomicrobia bacterium]|nr:DUF2905 domain-containing protein [Verrucomicrobiota bacterium]